MARVESYNIDDMEGAALLSTITDTTFPELFASLSTGRASSDLVLKTIIEGMLSGHYRPGDKVNARQLSEDLKVSIVPVREAIHMLAGEGVVELSARRGARIRTLNREEVRNWWEIHGAIGKLGCRMAAKHIADREDNVAKVQDAMDLIRENAGELDGFEFIMVLLRFHLVLNDVANMPELNEASRRLGVFFWAVFYPEQLPMNEYPEAYVLNHQRVADAVMAGDHVAAEAAYQYHIDWSDALIAGERPEPGKPWVHHESP